MVLVVAAFLTVPFAVTVDFGMVLLLKISRKLQRQGNIVVLPGFVTAHQQQQQALSVLCVVHAKAGAEFDLQLRHALGEIAVLAPIAVNQSIHAYLNPRTARTITQSVDPFTVHLGLFDAHA